MKKFFLGLAVYAISFYGLGALLLPATSEASAVTYLAKCQGPTSQYPQKHVIYQTLNGVWKILDPSRCYPPWNRSGDLFHATLFSNGTWLFTN